ncbi:hypothetical protein H4R20_000168 [Coemansia guatemalensis]|uniref:RanBD1 domain-containing protein n=1 Tax=Coemansia guatemalensis TaxID=2761395 RepID=A0A9W8I6R3_9FUNG|nr:hypothetical protein H4R20_000168 [Coemansia guatemalensis]
MSCETVGAENKRKRQDSIQGTEVLGSDANDSSERSSPSVDKHSVSSVEDQQERKEEEKEEEEEGSSPAKRPRTSEDGNEESDDDIQEPPAEAKAAEVKAAEPTKPTEAAGAPVFGMSFASSRGLSGFAAAAKVATPFSTFAGAAATSGFAKYASATSPTAATAAEAEGAKSAEVEDKKEASIGESSKGNKTFEDMLTAEGKESLATNAAMSVMVPAMAHANVSELSTVPVRTYEEDETCLYSTKAKLYELSAENWKERGGGQFKVNQRNNDPMRCRLVMRTDQTFRLILNVPLFAGMKLGSERRFVRFTCLDTENMKPVTFALRFASEAIATEAHDQIAQAIPPAPTTSAEENTKADKGKAPETAGDSDSESEDEDYQESSAESDDDEIDSEEEFDTDDEEEDGERDEAEDAKAGAGSSETEKSRGKQPE